MGESMYMIRLDEANLSLYRTAGFRSIYLLPFSEPIQDNDTLSDSFLTQLSLKNAT